MRSSFISEVAFAMASRAATTSKVVPGSDVEDEARDFMRRLPGGGYAESELTSIEWLEAKKICGKIQRYVSPTSDAVYSPLIPGCGVVDLAIADICHEGELIEVKTVTRQFRGADFRQALTYAAMLYASDRTVDSITLLNPRRAVYVKGSLDLIAEGAGGTSGVELMQELVELMTGLQTSA
ncbi:hypothetical protein ACQEU3_28045 [Spirillospora sp. CA-253888]